MNKFTNPHRYSVYECQNPVRLSSGIVPLNSVKEQFFDDMARKPHMVTRYKNFTFQPIYVRCRRCDSCRRLDSRQWQSRLAHHANYIRSNYPNPHIYFITLSFSDEHLPEHLDGDNLNELATYHLVQSFIRSLRDGYKGEYSKAGYTGSIHYESLSPLEFDYYVVGEFGSDKKHIGHYDGNHRFHYHIILFLKDDSLIPDYFQSLDGVSLPFLLPQFTGLRYDPSPANPDGLPLRLTYINSGYKSSFKDKKKKRLQTGKEATFQFILSKIWRQGIVSVGSCDTSGAFGYLSQYAVASLEDCQDGYRPFHRQSIGIARPYFQAWQEAIFNGNKFIMPLDPVNAKYGVVPIPAYYMKKFGNDEVRIARNLELLPAITNRLDSLYPEKVKPISTSFLKHFTDRLTRLWQNSDIQFFGTIINQNILGLYENF